MPYENYIGISKKIWDKFERRRLKKIAKGLRQKDTGIIIRTVAEGKSEEHIVNDFNSLLNSWNRVSKVAEKEEAPALVYEDLETASSVVRDLLTPDVEKIIIDSKRLFKKTQKYLEEVSPSLAERLELYKLKLPLLRRILS